MLNGLFRYYPGLLSATVYKTKNLQIYDIENEKKNYLVNSKLKIQIK